MDDFIFGILMSLGTMAFVVLLIGDILSTIETDTEETVKVKAKRKEALSSLSFQRFADRLAEFIELLKTVLDQDEHHVLFENLADILAKTQDLIENPTGTPDYDEKYTDLLVEFEDQEITKYLPTDYHPVVFTAWISLIFLVFVLVLIFI